MICRICKRDLAPHELWCRYCLSQQTGDVIRTAHLEHLRQVQEKDGEVLLVQLGRRGVYHVANYGYRRTLCGMPLHRNVSERQMAKMSKVSAYRLCEQCQGWLRELPVPTNDEKNKV